MRLVDFDAIREISKHTTPTQALIEIEQQILQIKQKGMYQIGPSLVNGLILFFLALTIYAVLHYRYYKKKNHN